MNDPLPAEEEYAERAAADGELRYHLADTGFTEVPKKYRRFYRRWRGEDDGLAPNEVLCPVCKVVIRSTRALKPGDKVYCMPCTSRPTVIVGRAEDWRAAPRTERRGFRAGLHPFPYLSGRAISAVAGVEVRVPAGGGPMRRNRVSVLSGVLLLSSCVVSVRADAGPVQAGPGGRQPRVSNGVVVQDRPTTGALLSRTGTNYQLICSGTLVGCETFLTAAHCVCDNSPFAQCGTPLPSRYSIYLQDVGIVDVSSIAVDPTYSFGHRGDVAVLTLSSAVTGVAPTPINTAMRPPPGTSVEIAGYGLTRAGADDTGVLRRGLAETSTCTAADDDYHVCWAFTDPLGTPGFDSNTCNGDSGGPLFADLGTGDSVIGITSGGTSSDCLPTDASFDADVYVHRAYIQSIGGVDLANTSCGSIAQVGEPGADRSIFGFEPFGKQQQACRKEISKQYSAYVLAALRASQSCLDGVADGSRTAPCPDGAALGALAAATDKVSVPKLSSRCPGSTASTIDPLGLCAGATNATDLASCILAAGDAAVSAALASEYADDDPSGTIGDAAARDCQKAVGRAGAGLLKSSLKAATKCQASLDNGKTSSCPDTKTSTKYAKAATKAGARITAGCSNAAVAALDGAATFGGSCGGVTMAGALATCEIADHAGIRDDLAGLLADRPMETDIVFTVPPGAALLRVTLNGRDNGSNDLDLYIRAGSPATTAVYDDRSENGGMFEETGIALPAAGTWYAHIERYSGDGLIPYQLTATSFQP